MSGQYPGQFGPPPGGAFPGGGPAGGIPGAVPYPGPPTVMGPVPSGPRPAGPYGVLGRVLVVLAPLLSIGLLGMVPSLLLAVRRRRAYDIVGAVAFAGLFLAYIVAIGVAGNGPKGSAPTADTVGMVMMVLMWFVPPAHFLVMDRRAVWEAGRPRPAAPGGHYAPQAVTAPYPAQPAYGYPAPAAPTAAQPFTAPAQSFGAQSFGTPAPFGTPAQPFGTPAQPFAAAAPYPPVPAPDAGPATSDELRELGELLRRQAREGRP
ncbi:hypothetical protein [Kitasatospora sp. NPDC002965]|uniref:hypothetical protein n=1 Tax=Kitasatospora sp. NPDC002965 TaxID=3154775 RepID=UPI0033A72445